MNHTAHRCADHFAVTLKGIAVMPKGEPTTNITSAGALVNLMNGGYTNYALNTSN